ncbi:ROK family protein [Nocardia sp. ET3-3]|uniref:ROK family protein n=1 Tax=Nocardia terrae TaxID=2675851 RepID=A0A7K1V6W6_9NOCA|nr:ROK family transcriptional regulator [Nocardia terrae]MVU82385.1 ROK family protein [Nocardia terrae]
MTGLPGPVHLRRVRTGNLQALLLAMLDGPASRAELAQRTGLTKATVSSLAESLLRQRILAEDPEVNTGRGRPSRPLRFSEAAPVAVGAEINVRHLAVSVQRLDGSTAAERRVEIDNRRLDADELIDRLTRLVRATLDESGREALGFGLAVPGIVHDGMVVHAPNVPGLTDIRIGDRLAAALGTSEVAVDNEANLAALAHVWPQRLAGDDFIYVSGDVGIGAGIVLGGSLFRGGSGFAGELGHVIIERAGRPCTCGSQGCVEQYAGLQAILAAAGQPHLEALRDALREGDTRGRSAVNCAGSALGTALASLINICDVATVVLGGSYATFFDELAPGVRAELGTGVLAAARRPVTLAVSSLGRDAVARGAAALITRRHCLAPELLLAPELSAGDDERTTAG